MRPVLYLVLTVCCFAACKNDDPTIEFTLPVRNQLFTIDAGLSTFDSHFYNFVDVPTGLDSLASFFNYDMKDAAAIRPATARLDALFGGADYSFAREMSLRICSDTEAESLRNGDPVQCNREIFWRNPVPENSGGRLDLVPNENNLLEALRGRETATFQLKLVSPLFYSPDQFIETRLSMDFQVFSE